MFSYGATARTTLSPLTRDLFERELDNPVIASLTNLYRKAVAEFDNLKSPTDQDKAAFEKAKRNYKGYLSIITPHATFKPGSRRITDKAVPNNCYMLDYDHVEGDVREFFNSLQDPYTDLVLAHVTPSGRGLRLIYQANPLVNYYEAMQIPLWQAAKAAALGNEIYDAACKDLCRCSFLFPRSELIYVDYAKMFEEHPAQVRGTRLTIAQDQVMQQAAAASPPADVTKALTALVEAWIKQRGTPAAGSRNTSLFELASHLHRTFPTATPALLDAVTPDWGLPVGEKRTVIRNACKYDVPLPSMCVEFPETDKDQETCEEEALPLPEKLPEHIRKLLEPIPDMYKSAAALAVFPALATNLTATSFRYCDNQLHEATLMHVLVGESGSGKSCADPTCNALLAGIMQRDALNRAEMSAWREKVQTLSKNAERPPRPVLPIQVVSADITSAALLRYASNAAPSPLYVKVNELTMFDRLQNKFDVFCNAFDHNNKWGAARASENAVDEVVTLRFNWLANATPRVCRNYFRRAVSSGAPSRISFSVISSEGIGAPLPRYGAFDEPYYAYANACATTLSGYRERVIDDNPLTSLAEAIVEHAANKSIELQSQFYWEYSHRAALIAWLRACVLYLLNSRCMTEEIHQFAIWSFNVDMQAKTMLFENDYSQASADTPDFRSLRSPLSLLAPSFTYGEFAAAAARCGNKTTARNLRASLAVLKARGKITLSDGVWKKISDNNNV